MNPEDAQRKWAEAVAHLELAIELYGMQMDAGRLFLHEHPVGATSWQVEAMQKFMARDGG